MGCQPQRKPTSIYYYHPRINEEQKRLLPRSSDVQTGPGRRKRREPVDCVQEHGKPEASVALPANYRREDEEAGIEETENLCEYKIKLLYH